MSGRRVYLEDLDTAGNLAEALAGELDGRTIALWGEEWGIEQHSNLPRRLILTSQDGDQILVRLSVQEKA